ncbi:MAG: hypothetical protein FJX29_10080 [Alphaproteobacteria bacterium]|nr:hypothetical protein [Alphaproteobacteria bacterium]
MFRNKPATPAAAQPPLRDRRLVRGGSREPDETDYEQRHFVNLAAAVFLLALAICIAWTIRIFDQQQALERCIASGRKDCVQIAQPPKNSYRQLTH